MRVTSLHVTAVVAGILIAGALRAQTPPSAIIPRLPTPENPAASITAAADSITVSELAQHVAAIAHDSIGGRDTPSRGLELAAKYVAKQFLNLGLTPSATRNGADDGTGIQLYPIPGQRRVDYDTARVSFLVKVTRGGLRVVDEEGNPQLRYVWLKFIDDIRPVGDTARLPVITFGSGATQRGVLVAGPHTLATLRDAKLRDKFVLYVPSAGTDSAMRQQIIAELIATNLAVAVVSDEDSVTFARRAQATRQQPFWLVDSYMRTTVTHGWGFYVRAEALREVLPAVNVDLVEARTTTQPVVRRLPSLVLMHMDRVNDTTRVKPITAPNVVAVLPGTDPGAREYLVLSAHLDNRGARDGANDNALGVAGILTLAKALSQPGAGPRRPIVFVATSGGAKDFWGARYFLHESQWARMPFVLDLTLDMLGQGARDSVHVAGLDDLKLPVRVDWLAAAHPELGLTVVDVGTAVTAESDHFAFIEAAVPSLYVSNGTHADSPAGSDTPAQLDLAQAARILKLVFYATEELANAAVGPRWSSEGRRRRVEVFGE